MDATQVAKKIPLLLFRTASGSEPVRESLNDLLVEERPAIGTKLLQVQ